MSKLSQDVSLQPFHTFHIDAKAEWLGTFNSVEALSDLLVEVKDKTLDLLVLGGGSNVLFTQDVEGAVLVNLIEHIEVVKEDKDHFYVRVGAGVNWHSFVLHCIANDWAGVENLSLIPGSVGASPMQNIGAYGVEIKDVFEELEAYHIKSGEVHRFDHVSCEFGYRESVFKRRLKGEYIITSVTYRLNKTPSFRIDYGAIKQQLDVMKVGELSIKAVSDAVIAIRESKLPNPDDIGNAGSFFKNPVISNSQFEVLKGNHPNVAAYPAQPGFTKVAAGWLIDQAGWKGKTLENYGVHKFQALVLVNYGGARGQQIFDLSQAIMDDVESKYGIVLEREVNIH